MHNDKSDVPIQSFRKPKNSLPDESLHIPESTILYELGGETGVGITESILYILGGATGVGITDGEKNVETGMLEDGIDEGATDEVGVSHWYDASNSMRCLLAQTNPRV
jgi:hypothetical protein